MRYVALVLCLFLYPLASLAQLDYPPEMQGARAEVFKSTSDLDLNVWIFEPNGHDIERPRPAIVFFFGGIWRRGSPAQFEHQARFLASHGMVAVVADYQVLDRNGTTMDAAGRDAKAAVRWVRENASRLGVDPNRIAAAGGSSGGHLAASTATLPEHDDLNGDTDVEPTPDALVLFNPALVIAPIAGRSDIRGARPDIVGAASRESLSPFHHVRSGIPPTIIFHGKADSRVHYLQSELFTEAMLASGNKCELVGYEGEDHGFSNYGQGDGSAYTDTMNRTVAFFVSLGWLSEP